MKEAKVIIYEEKEILQKLKILLLNFRRKSLNGNEKIFELIKEIDALNQER